jgi:phage terminase large subunit GpA-like protein
MLAAGQWIPQHQDRPKALRGYFIWAAYSPFVSWQRLVSEWLAIQGDRTQLKAFTNTVLGEEWEDRESELDEQVLAARRTRYPAPVPRAAGLLTCGVDVQGDRLEATVVGWGAGEQAWTVTHEILPGNPGGKSDVWDRLDAFLAQGWEHESGHTMPIRSTCLDSGGHHTDEVYAFVHARPGRNVWAVKGSSTPGAQAVSPPHKVERPNLGTVQLFLLGTDTLKDSLFARLGLLLPGPRYVHFPNHLPDDYFEQLAAEVARTKWINRRAHRVYELRRGRRNEALDCWVYALAALYILGPWRQQLGVLAENLAKGEQPPWPGTRGVMGARKRRRVRHVGVDA